MSTPAKTPWRIVREHIASCNCAWGCPCQFNALPTSGQCEGANCWQIREGHFGTIVLDGVRFAQLCWWPGAMHEGNGVRQLLIDEQATPDQRAALMAIASGTQGGALFEIFAAVCPTGIEPVFVPITFQSDRERRQGFLHIPGLVDVRTEPIKNPVTGAEHRARVVLPDGFGFK